MGFFENNLNAKVNARRGWKNWLMLSFLFLIAAGLQVSAQVGGEWMPEGAAPNTQGQVENIVPNDEVVGAVHVVVTHPTNADIVWVGAVNGGVWRTDNATVLSPNWVRLTDSMTSSERSLSIGALDLDPTDGTFQTLIAGLGSYSSFLSIGGDRSGLLRTTDGGATWTALGTVTLAGARVSGVAARGSTIVVSVQSNLDGSLTGAGVFRSTNSGATFTQVSVGNGATTGLPACEAFDLTGDPTDNSRLFTSTRRATVQGGTNGIYRSDDTGATWTRVSSATMETQMANNSSNVEIAVGNNNNVYVAIANNGRLAGLHRSGDGGGTWTALDLPSPTIHPGGQAGTHMSIVADPNNAFIVYVGGDRQNTPFPNGIGAVDFSGNLFRINAQAAPGSQAAHLTHSSALGAAGGGTASSSSPHADSREMAFDAAGNLIETDDGGVYKRTNPQSDTGDWTSMIGNLQTAEYHNIAYDANANVVMGGAQDTGSSAQETAGSFQWVSVSTADGGDTVVDDISSPGFSTRYASFQNLGGFRRRVYDANNVLQSSTSVPLSVISGPGLSPSFVTPLEINRVDGNRLLILASNGTYESLDQGNTISSISTANHVFDALGSDPISYGADDNADIIYIGSTDRIFVRTGAPGSPVTQSATYPGTGTGRIVRDTVLDPAMGSRAFAVDQQTIYQTDNAGTSWTNITGNIASFDPGILRSLEYLDNDSDDALVVGSDRGIFVAFASDMFSVWQRLGTGIPYAPVMELDYDRGDDLLVAGLMGRGSWTLMEPLASDCPLDLSGNGMIDQADLNLAIEGWNTETPDVDGDDQVTILDLLIILNAFGNCP